MSWIHFHLLVNHFPIVGSCILLVLLIVSLFWPDPTYRKIILCLVMFVTIVTYLANMSGPFAEHQMRAANLIASRDAHGFIQLHEANASWTLFLSYLAGLLALIGLFVKGIIKWVIPCLLVSMLVMTGFAAWTSLLGGLISYPEIRSDAISKVATEYVVPRLQLGPGKKQPRKNQNQD